MAVHNIDDLISKIDDLITTLNKPGNGGGGSGNGGNSRRRRHPRSGSVSDRADYYYHDARRSAGESAMNRAADIHNFFRNDRRWAATSAGRSTHSTGRFMAEAGKVLSKQGGALGAFGGAVSKAGGMLTKFAGWIGVAIEALKLIGKAAKAIANADATAQDIQNRKNTALTERSIELSKLTTASLIDDLTTTTQNELLKFNTEARLMQEQQRIENARIIADTQAKIGAVIGDVNTSAWEALAAHTEYNAEIEKLKIETATERAKYQRAQNLKTTEFEGRQETRQMDREMAEFRGASTVARLNQEANEYIKDHPFATSVNGWVGDGFYDQWNANHVGITNVSGRDEGAHDVYADKYKELNAANATGWGVLKATGLDFGIVDASYRAARTKMERDITNDENELKSLQATVQNSVEMRNSVVSNMNQVEDAAVDASSTVEKAAIDARKTIELAMQKMSQKVEDAALKLDKLAIKTGYSRGLIDKSQLSDFRKETMFMVSELARQFGMQQEEFYQTYMGLDSNTGRSRFHTLNEMRQVGGLGYYLDDYKLSSELVASSEIFNTSVETSVDTMWTMVKQINKIGLDSRKYVNDAVKNLQLAQRYDFRNGVRGLFDMSRWAQEVRFNMSNLGSMLDQIQEGGLEGNITNAAKMQVLGGRFAMGADPLAIMYEGFDAPEDLVERFNMMIQGMGYFNSETGKVDFSRVEQMQLREFAKLTNQSLSDVRDQASYYQKRAHIEPLLRNRDLTDEEKRNIINRAYYKDNKWMVNGIGRDEVFEVGNITKNDIGRIEASTPEGRMDQLIGETVAWQDKMLGLTTSQTTLLALMATASGALDKNQMERYEKTREYFSANFGDLSGTVTQNMQSATDELISALLDTRQPEDIQVTILKTLQADVTAIRDKLVGKTEKMSNETPRVGMVYERGNRNIVPEGGTISGGMIISQTIDPRTNRMRLTQACAMDNVGSNIMVPRNVPLPDLSRIRPTPDGVLSANGTPMLTQASSVTPIHDGNVELAQSDPLDHALFAKVGGPFDKLFNGILKEVDGIYSYIRNNDGDVEAISQYMPTEIFGNLDEMVNSPFNKVESRLSGVAGREEIREVVNAIDKISILPVPSKDTPIEPKPYQISPEVLAPQVMTPPQWEGGNSQSNQISFKEPLKIELGGKIELGLNGQSMDVTKGLTNNPMFIRQLTQLISEAISRNMCGGKSNFNGGQLVGGIGFSGA